MALFGITGGIGSGKSYVCDGLRKAGYEVYDTDREAQRIMAQNPCVRSQIELLFGSDIFDGDTLNRREVARQVFQNPQLLKRLNQQVHPAVRFDLEEWTRLHTTSNNFKQFQTISNPLFVESAILFESGLDSLCQAVICVTAPVELRIDRVMRRSGLSRQEADARISNQLTETDLLKRADLLVQNDGSQTLEQMLLHIQNFCYNFAR